MTQLRIPCLWMRGGTSKGAYFLASDLPEDPALRDRVLLAVMGSPDARQIDGLGGADSLTSKVAIVRRSQRQGCDIDYLFAQVAVDAARVDYGQNCGNILAGVGPFAVERGLVAAREGTTRVHIYMENTAQMAIAHVHTPNATVEYQGATHIDGVPGTAAPIVIDFAETTSELLPTGRVREEIEGVQVTCIDRGMPTVLLPAAAVGCTGYESCAELDASTQLKARLETIRRLAAARMGLGDVATRSVPKVCLIAAPRAGGALCTRSFIPQRCHSAIGVLGAASVAAACAIDGSVAQDVARLPEGDTWLLSIEHPSGELSVQLRRQHGRPTACGVVRTARLLFDGHVCIPRSVWPARRP